jgi:hypothetical protein
VGMGRVGWGWVRLGGDGWGSMGLVGPQRRLER